MVLINKAFLDTQYDQIKAEALTKGGCTILIFVSPDGDSLCACKMLTTLFQSDCLAYKIKPVMGYENLANANQQLESDQEELSTIIMLNCGGIVDLADFLVLAPHMKVYVFDAHRPYHLANVEEDNEQIKLIDDGDMKLQDYPLGLDGDSESDESDSDEDGDRESSRRRTESGSIAETRRLNRRRVAEYYSGSYYALPSSVLMWDLASQMDKSSNSLLWTAIIGLTDQFIQDRIPYNRYTTMVNYFREEVNRFNVQADEEGENTSDRASRLENDELVTHIQNGHIEFTEELRFMLLRHWNLYDSMYHSQYVASRLGIWREPGREKLLSLLAEMGLVLNECKQTYSFMTKSGKQHLKDRVIEYSKKYQLNDLSYGSFARQYETTLQVSAGDAAFALTALLEECVEQAEDEEDDDEEESVWERNFWNAYDALGERNGLKLLKQGLQNAIKLVRAIVDEGVSLIKKKSFMSSGTFRYCTISESAHLSLLGQPMASTKLGQFLVDALTDTGRRNRSAKPFVICTLVPHRNTYLVVGVTRHGSRLSAGRSKNPFGMAFRNAAEKVKARVKHDGFETSIIEVQSDDKAKFIEILHSGIIEI